LSEFLISYLFGISISTFRNYFKMILIIINDNYSKFLELPTKREAVKIMSYDCCMVIDGVEQRVYLIFYIFFIFLFYFL